MRRGRLYWGRWCVHPGRKSHLLDRSLLKERNKGISSRYVNVNLQRERERKQTQATGRLARITAIWRGTEAGQQLVIVSLIEGKQEGGAALKWVADVILNMFTCANVSATSTERLLDHIDPVSECLSKRDRQADSSENRRGRTDGRRTAAGAEPAGKALGALWSPSRLPGPHTSVTFGCSTKDSGVILGMSMWIWQQHGRRMC